MVLVLTLIVHIALAIISTSALVKPPDELCGDDLCANMIEHVTCSNQRAKNCIDVEFPDKARILKSQRVMLHSFNQYRNSWAGGYGLDTPRTFPGYCSQHSIGSSNMHRVVWNEELEAYARKSCSRCLVDDGDDCRDTVEGSVAQLFFLKFYEGERPPGDIEVFNSWILDAPYLTPAAVKNYTVLYDNLTSPTVIFWKFREIGCSSAFVTLLNSSSGRMVICNLFPAGPIYGWPIYRGGNPCEHCEIGFRCKEQGTYPMLCDKYLPSPEDVGELHRSKSSTCKGLPSNVFIIYAHFVFLIIIIEQCHKHELHL